MHALHYSTSSNSKRWGFEQLERFGSRTTPALCLAVSSARGAVIQSPLATLLHCLSWMNH